MKDVAPAGLGIHGVPLCSCRSTQGLGTYAGQAFDSKGKGLLSGSWEYDIPHWRTRFPSH